MIEPWQLSSGRTPCSRPRSDRSQFNIGLIPTTDRPPGPTRRAHAIAPANIRLTGNGAELAHFH
jgi:hypothetical protein